MAYRSGFVWSEQSCPWRFARCEAGFCVPMSSCQSEPCSSNSRCRCRTYQVRQRCVESNCRAVCPIANWHGLQSSVLRHPLSTLLRPAGRNTARGGQRRYGTELHRSRGGARRRRVGEGRPTRRHRFQQPSWCGGVLSCCSRAACLWLREKGLSRQDTQFLLNVESRNLSHERQIQSEAVSVFEMVWMN